MKKAIELFNCIRFFEKERNDELGRETNEFGYRYCDTDDYMFNYIALKNYENYNNALSAYINASKEMISVNKIPNLIVPYVQETEYFINKLIADGLVKHTDTETFTIFKDKSFLEKEIKVAGDIEFCISDNAHDYAMAVYNNFNDKVSEFDLCGCDAEYIPNIENSFNKLDGVTKFHYVAKDKEKIVATVTVSIIDNCNIGGLANCSTAGLYRGKNIGKKLLQFALKDSFSKGMKECLFYTEKGNISEMVYLKCGFEKICENYLLQPTKKFYELIAQKENELNN